MQELIHSNEAMRQLNNEKSLTNVPRTLYHREGGVIMAEGGFSPDISTGAVGASVDTIPNVDVKTAPDVAVEDNSQTEEINKIEEDVRILEEAEAKKLTEDTTKEPNVIPDSPGGEGSNQTQEPDAQTTANTEQKQTPETEAQTPQEAPKIPEKLANDPEYEKAFGKYYAEALQKGEVTDANLKQIKEKAVSEYYSNSAKKDLENGIKSDVNDKLYKEKLGEATNEAISRGETLDPKRLSQEALAKYRQAKDLQDEKQAEPQAEQNQQLERQIRDLATRNAELTSSLEKTNQRLAELTNLTQEIVKYLKEEDEKNKKNLLRIILEIAAVVAVSTVAETGKQIVPQLGGQR